MKIELNDPRLTAFALGELHGDDAADIVQAMRTDSKVRTAVEEIRQTSFGLLETFHGEAEMLTSTHLETIRRASSEPNITDIASARIPVWKRPVVAGMAAAVVVGAALYFTLGGNNPDPVSGGVADGGEGIDWSKLPLEELTATSNEQSHGVVQTSPDGNRGSIPSANSLEQSIEKDPNAFRKHVAQRISSGSSEEVQRFTAQTDSHTNSSSQWLDVAGPTQLLVPLRSGVSSWPLLERYVGRDAKLPPSHSIRIDELINHFSYAKPQGMTENGVSSQLEICRTPWNPSSCLLAVHVSNGAQASVYPRLNLSPRVKRIRQLGQQIIQPSSDIKRLAPQAVTRVSNYVIYEVELNATAQENTAQIPVADLFYGGDRLVCPAVSDWSAASQSLRFASTVAATGMLLSKTPELASLSPESVKKLLSQLESDGLDNAQHRAALPLLLKAVDLMHE